MLLKVNAKHHKGSFSHTDIIANKNTEVILVNTLFIKEVTPFNINEINGYAFNYFGYLYGSKATLWYDDFNKIHCIESVEEIYSMIRDGIKNETT